MEVQLYMERIGDDDDDCASKASDINVSTMDELCILPKTEPTNDDFMTSQEDPLELNSDVEVAKLEVKEEEIEPEEVKITRDTNKLACACGICGEKFSDINELSRHVNKRHRKSKGVPQGANTLAPGSIILPQGSNTLVPGSIILPQGSNTLVPGSIILQQGANTLAHGSIILPQGSNTLAPGSIELAQNMTAEGDHLLDGTLNSQTSAKANECSVNAPVQMFKIETKSNSRGSYMILDPMTPITLDAAFDTEPKVEAKSKVPAILELAAKVKLAAKSKVAAKSKGTSKLKMKGRTIKRKSTAEADKFESKRPPRVYTCALCKSKFDNERDLTTHWNLHVKKTDRPQHGCEVCHVYFETTNELTGHLRTAHESAAVKCDFCKTILYTEKTQLEHARTHIKKVGNECKDCNVYFINRKLWQTHRKLHSELYECHLCSKKFGLNNDLYKHLKEHSDYLPYKCEACNNKYKEKSDWLKHMHSHNENGPYQCEICNRTFRQREEAYKSHMLKHAPFLCHVCNRSHDDISELHRHMQAEKHEYECYACNKTFVRKLLLKEHLFNEHIDALKNKYSKSSFF